MIRAFLALVLDDATRSALAVQQALLPLPSKVSVENLHLTLAFLGEVPQHRLEDAHEFFLAIRVPAFSLSFEGLGLFGGDRPRTAYAATTPCEPLMRLQRKVEAAARQAGIAVEGRKYLPHVTLGRFRPPGLEDTMRLERAVVEAGGFRAGPMPVGAFDLYESTLGRGGSRYDLLARYPLG
jgi:RNA 2',3'-cyclic 3'-phosphodiesterase